MKIGSSAIPLQIQDVTSLIPFFYRERNELFFILDNGTPFDLKKSNEEFILNSHYTVKDAEEIEKKLAYFDNFLSYHFRFKHAAMEIQNLIVEFEFKLINSREADPMKMYSISHQYATLQNTKKYIDEIVELLDLYQEGLRTLLFLVYSKIQESVNSGKDDFTPNEWKVLHDNYWTSKKKSAIQNNLLGLPLNGIFGSAFE